MKTNYFYSLILFMSVYLMNAQNVTITKVIESNCSSPFVKTVELYVDGTVDFANDDVVLNYMQNGDAWADNQIDISGLGVQTDAFVYIVRDIPLMQAEFPSTTFDSSNTIEVGTSTNGDDGYQVVLNGVVVSQFGETQTDGTGTAWEHKDAVATRLDGVPDSGSFDVSHWDITAVDSLDNETACQGGNGLEAYFASLGGTFPLGSGSGWTPDCTTFLGAESTTCDSQGVGANDDTYSASLAFTGANNGNTFDVTASAGTVSGDDPGNVETGTITVTNIPEGTDVTISVSDTADGGNCDLSTSIESPACVPLVLNEALFDPPSGDAGDANADGTRDPIDDEFLEFFNNSDAPLDVSGYTISDSDQLRHVFPASTIIPANGVVVVFGGGTPTGSFGGAIVQTASEGTGLVLNNSGDTATIENADGNVVRVFSSAEVGLDFGDNQSITRNPDITGDYDLHTNANPNLLFSPGLDVNGQTLSIDEVTAEETDISVYPNPVDNGKLNIKSSVEIDQVSIYDLSGKKVLEQSFNENEFIDVDRLNSGAYILSLQSNNQKISKTILIK